MKYLFGVTFIWAFSFSLNGVYLSGYVDAWFSVLMRIGIATMIFLPLTGDFDYCCRYRYGISLLCLFLVG